MSIPTWSYDETFYVERLHGTPVTIRTDPVKGKGLFALKAMKKDDVVHSETALCCTQNVDDFLRNIPVCGNCLISLETPRGIVARQTKNKVVATELPYAAVYQGRRGLRCVHADSGCTMMFCSTRCREAAWSHFHFAGCRGTFDDDSKAAFDEFVRHSWQQGGVDYSDTHFLAFRFLSIALTAHRLHRKSLVDSYAPMAQLIKASLHKFHFSFLLRKDDEFDESVSAEAKQKALHDRFLQYRDDPLEEPTVKEQEADSPSKDETLQKGLQLVRQAFRFSKEETEFVTMDVWSHLLGAVLLNGQERAPQSPYHTYNVAVSSVPLIDQELKAYHRKLRSMGYSVAKLNTSSCGQGIYAVGCLFNHSCKPNLQVMYAESDDETLYVTALRDIEEGEELCISYIDENMHYYERHQQLFEHYLFTCTCEKCLEDRLNDLKVDSVEAKSPSACSVSDGASDKEKENSPAATDDAEEK